MITQLAIQFTKMPSALIRKIEYDPSRRCLSVWFVHGGARRYDYEGVPPETYADFTRAFSKGSFFNRSIRDRFRFSVAEPLADEAEELDLFESAPPLGRAANGGD